MSNVIDIRKFVDVNIIHHATSKLNTTRDTSVLFVSVSDYSTLSTGRVVSSWNEASSALGTTTTLNNNDKYAKAYFDNGGQKLFIKAITLTDLADEIEALPDEYIICACPTGNIEAAILTLNAKTTFYGIKIKFGLQVDDETAATVPHVIDAYTVEECAAIAAYLSKIDISKTNSIKDYDFTVINTDADELSDSDVDALMDANVNIALKLAGQIRAIGGNTADGLDLVNEYTLIILQQTVTDKVLSVLVEKIKGELGCAAIHTAIAQELSRYVMNGYLATDKIWKDDDLTVVYGEPAQTYTVIKKDTPLLLGYQIKILPYASLTASDKAAHKAPPIYIVLADSYGIRKVTINGEVF